MIRRSILMLLLVSALGGPCPARGAEDGVPTGLPDLEYQLYHVHHLKNYRVGEESVQQLLGTWFEVYLPGERMVLKLNELSDQAWSVEETEGKHRLYKKGIEILQTDVDVYRSSLRSRRGDGYVVLELPIKIDIFHLTEGVMQQLVEVVKTHSADDTSGSNE